MYREILFRGKRKDNGEWVYGYYATQSNHACFQRELKYTSFILKDEFMDWGLGGLAGYEVIPESVGQFTGLTDKNGNKIFEGDVVATFVNDRIQSVGDVQFKCGVFGVEWTENKVNRRMVGVFGQRHNLRRLDDETMDDIEVIGNIYDNKELLK